MILRIFYEKMRVVQLYLCYKSLLVPKLLWCYILQYLFVILAQINKFKRHVSSLQALYSIAQSIKIVHVTSFPSLPAFTEIIPQLPYPGHSNAHAHRPTPRHPSPRTHACTHRHKHTNTWLYRWTNGRIDRHTDRWMQRQVGTKYAYLFKDHSKYEAYPLSL